MSEHMTEQKQSDLTSAEQSELMDAAYKAFCYSNGARRAHVEWEHLFLAVESVLDARVAEAKAEAWSEGHSEDRCYAEDASTCEEFNPYRTGGES